MTEISEIFYFCCDLSDLSVKLDSVQYLLDLLIDQELSCFGCGRT